MLIPGLLFRLRSITLLVVLLGAAPAWALPIVSIDVLRENSTIDDTATAVIGAQVSVDIVISDVELAAGEALNGFEFDLGFDPAILSAISVIGGDFLIGPLFTIQQSTGIFTVDFAQVSLGASGASGSGRLATVTFAAVGLGSTDLLLTNVLLARPFGVELATSGVQGALVHVVVPEPSTAFLMLVGIGLLARHDRKVKHDVRN